MTPLRNPGSPSKVLARLAVTGMSLAVVALGALAVWAAIVTQNGADGLSRAGVQVSGHLRAIQALTIIDTSTDALEERIVPGELARLRRAQRVLDDSLDRMQNGGVRAESRIAAQAKPIVHRMTPAIDRFLARPPGFDSNGTTGAEEKMENITEELQVLLNDLDTDPSRLLATKLGSVTATERTVRATAFVLIPVGLGGVAACGWLLSLYRRRSEATMRAALDATAEEARTDQLTGLPNRRGLLEELEQRSNENQRLVLAIADLNGFKRYNDTFGHPAGDELLKRLGRKLATACEGRGFASRLGGDEFCVLLFGDIPADQAHALLSEALSDAGEGFRITAATGVAAVPDEARDASAALRLADIRMYAAKASAHPSAEQEMSGALTRMLDERHPGLGHHVEDVASLAVTCAEALGLSAEDVESVQRAAELHDIGKVAIPSEILTKQGALSDQEWEFMRRHSVIGERILTGVPSLERVAAMVRSSHERWDGCGYPDGLAGDEIPFGARIIHVVDAFCAMTEVRPYSPARSIESARRELLASSGTQFDPAVVTAFVAGLDRQSARAEAEALHAMALAF
ncbi:MAG TPA: diguanylate cyclase [Thermoleophilaceae bacterium]|nr:diguanylate cyclase [Thermoleophilaceae bacterium]